VFLVYNYQQQPSIHDTTGKTLLKEGVSNILKFKYQKPLVIKEKTATAAAKLKIAEVFCLIIYQFKTKRGLMTYQPPVYVPQIRNISIELMLSARTEKK